MQQAVSTRKKHAMRAAQQTELRASHALAVANVQTTVQTVLSTMDTVIRRQKIVLGPGLPALMVAIQMELPAAALSALAIPNAMITATIMFHMTEYALMESALG